MSIGTTLLSMMGAKDPREALLQSITAQGGGQGGAPYAAQPAAGAAPQQGGAPAGPGVQAPPQDPLSSPPDFAALYKDLLKYNSRESNINRGFGLIGSAISQDGNRQTTMNAFTGDRPETDRIGVNEIATLAKDMNAAQIARQQRAAGLAALPAIAKRYGLSMEAATLLFNTGELDAVIKEAEKPNSELRELANGQVALIDKTGGDLRGTYGAPKQDNKLVTTPRGQEVFDMNNPSAAGTVVAPPSPDVELRELGDGTIGMFDKQSQKFLGNYGPKKQNNQVVKDDTNGSRVIDLNNPTAPGVQVGTPDLSPERIEYRDYENNEAARGNKDILSFQQWRMTKPPTTQITNNVGGEQNSFAKKSGEYFAEDYQNMRKARMSARDMLNQYDLAEDALDTGIRTGSFGEAEQSLRKIGQSLGVDTDPKKVAGGEILKTVTNRMALLMRNPDSGMGMPGSVSDRDLTFLKEAQVGLSNSDTGNRTMLKAFRLLEQRKVEIANLADDYVKKNGKLDSGFDAEVKKYADANPMFENFEIAPRSRDDILKSYGIK